MSVLGGSTDRYTHTWAVILLLFLSLVTWLLPLHPRFKGSTTSTASSDFKDPLPPPTFKANCWNPAQFGPSHDRYTNTFCAEVFNAAIRGQTKGVGLYLPLARDSIPSGPRKANDDAQKLHEAFLARRRNHAKSGSPEKPGKKHSERYDFVYKRVPLILFVFAVCLTLPQIVWTLFSGFASMNTENILGDSNVKLLKEDSQMKLKDDVSRAVSDLIETKSASATILYLVFKFLLCAVVLLELIFLATILKEDFEVTKIGSEQSGNTTMPADDQVDEFGDLVSTPWLCDFQIAQKGNVHAYTIQCLFAEIEASSPSTQIPSEKVLNNDDDNNNNNYNNNNSGESATVYMFRCAFTVVLATLVVLVVINVFSLVHVVSKLFPGPCARHMTLTSDLSLDARLLLMAVEERIGHVMPDLADNFRQTDKGEKKGDGGEGSGESGENMKMETLQ